jgi:hypothetical protein
MSIFSYYDLSLTENNPKGLVFLFQFVFAAYMLVTTIVLINLLIAMMSDTYQRIQVSVSYVLFPCVSSLSFMMHWSQKNCPGRI